MTIVRAGLAALLAGALTGPLAAPASAQAVRVLPLRAGEISFAMRATKVNDFVGRVAVSRAEFAGNDLTNVTGVVEVRVADMRTGIGLRDSHLRNAMHADSLPLIRFELVGLDPAAPRGDTIPTIFQGHLTIHGVTHTIRAPGWVVVRPETIEVQAAWQLDMREYGIAPPTRFLGAIRVDPLTDLTVRLTFAR